MLRRVEALVSIKHRATQYGRTKRMAETGKKKVEEATKKVTKGEASKDKGGKSPKSGAMGGGGSEINESAGSKVKT